MAPKITIIKMAKYIVFELSKGLPPEHPPSEYLKMHGSFILGCLKDYYVIIEHKVRRAKEKESLPLSNIRRTRHISATQCLPRFPAERIFRFSAIFCTYTVNNF